MNDRLQRAEPAAAGGRCGARRMVETAALLVDNMVLGIVYRAIQRPHPCHCARCSQMQYSSTHKAIKCA
jgi:hypothetical protein